MVRRRVEPKALDQTYPAVAGSVRVARAALVRFAAEAGVIAEQIEWVRLATSEALTNVVKHAYEGQVGRMRVTAGVADGELCVLVADDGRGFRPHGGRGGLGRGLALIAAVCDELAIVKRGCGGTELWMWFKLDAVTLNPGGQSRGSVASATAPAASRFSITT